MRSIKYGFIQPIHSSSSLLLNANIPYTPLLRSSKGLRKKSKKLYPMVLAILFIKKVKKYIKKRKMREKILEQWCLTENSYYLDLWVMANCIKKPMEEWGIINLQQSLILFPEIESMIQLSQMMISVLNRALKTGDPYKVMVCKEMLNFVNGYKIYGGYFNSHHKSSDLLQQLSTSRELQMKQIESRMQQQFTIRQSRKQTLTLKDCMQQPFYRLFKYALLVKEYSKRLPKFHPDYEWAINCHNCFREINNYYNELMKKVEEKQKKNKLYNLYGAILYEESIFVNQVQASTALNQVKVYVFNHIVIVNKIFTHLGCEKQEKYGFYQLNQFSYIGFQDNMKYFKNGLILIGKTKCLHLYFSDDPSRLEFYKCILKIIKEIRVFKHQERIKFNRLSFTKSEESTERSSSQIQNRNFGFPEFHIEIVGCEMRPMGNISNNIIYDIRIMIPFYYEDEINLSKSQETIKQKEYLRCSLSPSNFNKNKEGENRKKSIFEEESGSQQNLDKRLKNSIFKCTNQRILLSFEQIQEISDELKKIYSNVPDIDPPLSEGSYSAKGKRKTKSHETRKIFIEQFLNFSFRNSSILNSPIWLLSKLRINSDIWNYATQRNFRLALFNIKQLANINYDFDHCFLCSRAKVNTLKQFEALRKQYAEKGNSKTKKLYCHNFFNLLRMKLLSLGHQKFNSTESVLLYYHYLEGRIDYPFFQHHCNDKINKIIKIYHLCVDDRCEEIQIDSKTTVGEVIDHMAYLYEMNNSFDFDLIVQHEKKVYTLDRDQFLTNIIKNLQIKFIECQPEASREKFRSSKSKNGLLNTIKNWGTKIFQTEQEPTKIYFSKSTYLLKSLEMKSFNSYLRKKQLEVEKIFWMIKKGKIGLSENQLYQLGAIFYCLREYNSIESFSYENMSSKLISKIISDEFSHLFQYKQEFKRKISDAIHSEREMLFRNQKKKDYLYHRVLELVSQKLGYKTYYIDVQAKQIPYSFTSKMQITENYKLGINNKNLIIKKDASIVCLFPIQQIEYDISVYSIYIMYQKWSFRFEGKMLFRFGEMVKKYKTILQKFPDHVAENIIL